MYLSFSRGTLENVNSYMYTLTHKIQTHIISINLASQECQPMVFLYSPYIVDPHPWLAEMHINIVNK